MDDEPLPSSMRLYGMDMFRNENETRKREEKGETRRK